MFAQVISAAPHASDAKLQARQSINFDLVESAPDPSVQPDDTSNYHPAAAIASVIAEVQAGNPLSERKRALEARDIVVSTYAGYTANIPLGNLAINAPLDCNQRVSTLYGLRSNAVANKTIRTHTWASSCLQNRHLTLHFAPLLAR
jgi:hypothetical protein